MDLPPVNGFDSILVVVDQGLTKGVILIPCDKTITAKGTAKLFCIKGLAYLTKSSQTEGHNSHQRCL